MLRKEHGYPSDVRYDAVASYEGGETARSIAERIGCSERTVRNWARMEGVAKKRGRPSKWQSSLPFMWLARRLWPECVSSLNSQDKGRRASSLAVMYQRWIGYCAALGRDPKGDD